MIVKISLPELETNIARSTVSKWHVAEGDAIGFGETICELEAAEWILPDTAGVGAIGSMGKRKKRKARRTSRGRAQLRYAVVASERATLHRIHAQEGTEIGVGDLLGTARVGSDDAEEPASHADMPDLRVVAKVPDITELI